MIIQKAEPKSSFFSDLKLIFVFIIIIPHLEKNAIAKLNQERKADIE